MLDVIYWSSASSTGFHLCHPPELAEETVLSYLIPFHCFFPSWGQEDFPSSLGHNQSTFVLLLEKLTLTQPMESEWSWPPQTYLGLHAQCRTPRTLKKYPYCCRSEDAEAYELQDGEFSSGIFMKYLKKHILQEKKVTHMLEDVLEGKRS